MHRDQVERTPESYSEEQIGWDAELMYKIINDIEKALNDLRNTGKVVGEITVTDSTPGDNFDEVIVAVRD